MHVGHGVAQVAAVVAVWQIDVDRRRLLVALVPDLDTFDAADLLGDRVEVRRSPPARHRIPVTLLAAHLERQRAERVEDLLLEILHEVIVDTRRRIDRRRVVEEIGARHAHHRLLVPCARQVADQSHVLGVTAVDEVDQVVALA